MQQQIKAAAFILNPFMSTWRPRLIAFYDDMTAGDEGWATDVYQDFSNAFEHNILADKWCGSVMLSRQWGRLKMEWAVGLQGLRLAS